MWRVCRIDDLGEINRGKSKHRPRNDARLFGGKYPFIQTGDVKKANLYINEYDTTYSEFGLAQSKLWPKDTLCITIAANIAESAILGIDACFPDSVVGFVPKKNKADLKFVKYLLDEFKVYMQQISKGTTQDNLSLDKLRRVKFYAPDYDTQVKIAKVISVYDDLIENNNRRIKILEKMAENLYKEWFVRFRFPGYEQTEFENGIPKGWQICRMSEFCYVTDGTHDTPTPVDVGVPLITGKCICSGTIDFSLAYNISHTAHEKIKKRSGLTSGDILFSNIGTVGNCCIVDYDREFSVKNVIIFKPETRNQTEYLYYWMTNAAMQEIFSAQTNGASQQFVGLIFMRNFKILVPTEEILTAFADKISIFTEHKRNLRKCNLNLTKQRDLLLPRLMSGKLEV